MSWLSWLRPGGKAVPGAKSGEKQTAVWYFVARRHRIAYLQVPKVASTSFRAAILLLDHPEVPAAEVRSDEGLRKMRHLYDKVHAAHDTLKGFFRFSFVRNPYARFASFYRNKILKATPETLEKRFARMGLVPGMSMEAILDIVEALPRQTLDPHIIPQSHFVFGESGQRADFVGRFEQIAEGVNTIRERSGVALEVGQMNATSIAPPGDPREGLPEAVRDRLAKMYAEDFERFGYEV